MRKIRSELSCACLRAGAAVGKVFRYAQIDLKALARNSFPAPNIEAEENKLKQAFEESKIQLERLIRPGGDEGLNEFQKIFQTHRLLLEDETVLEELRTRLKVRRVNIEHILAAYIEEMAGKLSLLGDDLLAGRVADLEDVYHRFLRNLLAIEHVGNASFRRIKEASVVVAERLIPSDIAMIARVPEIKGLIIQECPASSHVAILAKSLSVPVGVDVPGVFAMMRSTDEVLLDLYRGRIVVNPGTAEKKKLSGNAGSTAPRSRLLPPVATRDGIVMAVEANVVNADEAKSARRAGASGIGLLRSEFFYLSREAPPERGEEEDHYRRVMREIPGQPITIRLLDLGADKELPYLPREAERRRRPSLKGIRFLLAHRDLFMSHLSSIRPLLDRPGLRLLVPFVTTPAELKEARSFIDEVFERAVGGRRSVPIGAMVETPSAALLIDELLPHADFISIGTNDLTQHLFAKDREECADSAGRSVHPLLLRLLGNIIAAAHRAGKEASVCGEMASHSFWAGVLVGMGIDRLSVRAESIVEIRRALSEMTLAELRELAPQITALRDENEVAAFIAAGGEGVT